MNPSSPYRNTVEIAEFLRKLNADGSPNVQAARMWIDRHIPINKIRKAGRNVLVHIDDLEAALKTRDGSPA